MKKFASNVLLVAIVVLVGGILLSACSPAPDGQTTITTVNGRTTVETVPIYKYTVVQLRPAGGEDRWQTNQFAMGSTVVEFINEHGKKVYLTTYWRVIEN
jgi:hypothetical protein